MIDFVFQGYPKDHLTLQWNGLNLYCRGRVLKTASFEGSGSLQYVEYTTHGWGPSHFSDPFEKFTRWEKKTCRFLPWLLGRWIANGSSSKSDSLESEGYTPNSFSQRVGAPEKLPSGPDLRAPGAIFAYMKTIKMAIL